MTNKQNKQLTAIYLEQGFRLENEPTKKIGYQNDELLDTFKADPYRTLFYWGFKVKENQMNASLLYLHSIGSRFIEALSKDSDLDITKQAPDITEDELNLLLGQCPFVLGAESVTKDWLLEVWSELSQVFAEDCEEFPGSPTEFLLNHNANLAVVGRVYFHLVESKSEDFPFAFLATYSTATEDKQKANHVPLKHALLEYADDQQALLHLLGTVNKAADQSDFIAEMVTSGELFSPLRLTSEEAYTILKEIPIYEACGILCRIPDWWKRKNSSIKVSVSIGDKEPSLIGLDSLVQFTPSFQFGEERLTTAEINELMAQTEGLAFLKGKWIEVDHDKLQRVLEAYEQASQLDSLSLAEAMRLQAGIETSRDTLVEDVSEMTNGQWLNSIRGQLQHPTAAPSVPSLGFKADLREYQQEGFDWLLMMKRFGFGALLADDMGLGKTVQILALLDYLREQQDYKALLILPASLIGNWEHEITTFAPELRYQVIHTKTTFDLADATLFITTYGMASKLETLNAVNWDLLILDEAQAIKNPGTKQTKTIKEIPARFRIAMTGTPVENKLADLWSLFDFLNQGLLGTAKEFSSFAKRLQTEESYQKLRQMINPFIMRRLKTDKTIIQDLPDKVETKSYVTLSKKQVVLYKKLVAEIEEKLADSSGIQRKGLVLSAITSFKQICNHPDQFLSQEEYHPKNSGKFTKLTEICEPIYEKRERVLIFTQFKEMVEPLSAFLEILFQRPGLVLHGGTPVAKRRALVEEFNGDDYVPFMVLSLKAGGVGLNLTSANHVIHFDRWWNPAVENQATDRAFRIGQKKNVMVYKFITQGSIEEKIDEMIEKKQQLAGDIVASSKEKWLTELDNQELMTLFTLE